MQMKAIKNSRGKWGLAAAGVVGALAIQSASAYVISFSNSVGLTAPNTTGPEVWNSVAIDLPQFQYESLPGVTLTSVELVLSATIQVDVGLENLHATLPGSVSYTQTGTFTFSFPSSGTHQSQPTISLTSGLLGAYDGSLDGAGFSGVTYDNASATDTDAVAVSGSLAGYKGTSTFAVNVSGILGSGNDSSVQGKISDSIYNSALRSLEVTVNYTYTGSGPVPEGQTWVGGAALVLACGLGWVWRRRCGA